MCIYMKLLKLTMRLNASTCIIFGFAFVLASSVVNGFIGNTVAGLLPWVGVILIFNGFHLLFASRRSKPLCLEILYFIAGDIGWVVVSLLLVGVGLVITTQRGIIAALLVSAMVAIFAFLQALAYRKLCARKSDST